MRIQPISRYTSQTLAMAALLALMLVGEGCGKKKAEAATPAKTAAAKPAATNALAATSAAGGALTNNADPYTSDFETNLPPEQGKDPFYPDSKRRQKVEVAKGDETSAPVVAVLVLKAIIHGRMNSQAVINDQTFGVGETNEVVVPNGKVEVRCLEISTNSVRVQVTGQPEQVLTIEERK